MGKPNNSTIQWTNERIAQQLEEVAELLEAQDANLYRVRAYRNAATMLRELERPVTDILKSEGSEGLRRLPTIGISLSRSIEQLVVTGQINLLEQLRGETMPTHVLATVPGIGPILAERIYEQLGIETLAELENAAYDGRLAQVPGLGRTRVRAVRETLAGRLHRRPSRPERVPTQPPANQPPVSELLDVDREYRAKAKGHQLPRIAPRRFNPTHEAWLPVLHAVRGVTHYTALYSNTARAHELGAIRDWVVIYRDDDGGSGQWTVITGQYGPLKGRRIVRGREEECAAFYEKQPVE
jgi:putative hydrolase